MADQQNLTDRLREYRPAKAALFWSCAGCVALTLIIGFSWGGWVTEGTAKEMVQDASEEARAELASIVCVDQFLDGPDARAQLASLKEADYWRRESFIEDGGWATLPGMEEPVGDAAELCASRLADMELPTQEAGTSTTGTVVQ